MGLYGHTWDKYRMDTINESLISATENLIYEEADLAKENFYLSLNNFNEFCYISEFSVEGFKSKVKEIIDKIIELLNTVKEKIIEFFTKTLPVLLDKIENKINKLFKWTVDHKVFNEDLSINSIDMDKFDKNMKVCDKLFEDVDNEVNSCSRIEKIEPAANMKEKAEKFKQKIQENELEDCSIMNHISKGTKTETVLNQLMDDFDKIAKSQASTTNKSNKTISHINNSIKQIRLFENKIHKAGVSESDIDVTVMYLRLLAQCQQMLAYNIHSAIMKALSITNDGIKKVYNAKFEESIA